jgi:hypothetical protein
MPCHYTLHGFVCLDSINVEHEGSETEEVDRLVTTSFNLLMRWIQPWQFHLHHHPTDTFSYFDAQTYHSR